MYHDKKILQKEICGEDLNQKLVGEWGILVVVVVVAAAKKGLKWFKWLQ